MDPVEENHSLRADRFKQQVVRLDAYAWPPVGLRLLPHESYAGTEFDQV